MFFTNRCTPLRISSPVLRPVACLAVLLSLVAAPALAQTSEAVVVPSRITQPIDNASRVTMHGYVAPEANALNDRGAAPDSMPLERIHLVLKRSPAQEAALQQLLAGMHTPGGANYHKWLTPTQFGQQFGPSDQDIATVESWLSSQGFSVAGVKPGKQVIEFSGSVAQMRQAFGVQIHRYMSRGNIHYATATEPQIPAALAPVVAGFVSLNDFHRDLHSRLLGTASYNPKTGKTTPNWTYGTASAFSLMVSPGDFEKEYDVPQSASLQGQGESIAILDFSNINLDLVQQFRTLFGLPTSNLPTVIVDGNDPGIDGDNNPDGPIPGSSIESYLDVEWAGALAPQANIDLVIAADTATETGGLLAAEHAVYDDTAPIISSSIDVGGCEAQAGSLNDFMDSLWEQAAAEGITVIVAAGDSGSAGCDSDTQEYAVSGLGVNSWASTPWDVAVGGTDFYYSDYATGATVSIPNDWSETPTQQPATSIKQYIAEQPWNDSQYGLDAVNYYAQSGGTTIVGGSGGASSAALCISGSNDEAWNSSGTCSGTLAGYPKPSWQTGVTGTQNDKVRDIPDLALFAADYQNYSAYPICAEDGDCQPVTGTNQYQITGVGGTSAAAPAFAAIMALVDQQYGPQGQADFTLYPLKTQFPAAFHDITNGTNSVPCAVGSTNCISVANPITVTDPTYGTSAEGQLGTGTTPDYNAAAGYNLATGLGSVDAAQLINDWNKVAFTSTTVSLTSPSNGASYTHGQSVTVSGTVTGSGNPTGNVALMTSSTEPGNQGANFASAYSGGQSTFPLSSGAFTGSISTLPGGTYNVWANYGGDGTNAAGSSARAQITINPEASQLFYQSWTLNPQNSGQTLITTAQYGSSIPYGSQVLLTAIPTPSSQFSSESSCLTAELSGTGSTSGCPVFTPATGAVTFADGGTTLAVAPLNNEGEAEFDTGAFSVGSHSVTATYSGDSSYNASPVATATFTVSKYTPTVLLTAPIGTVSTGQPLVLTVLVEGYGIGSAPTGNVTFSGLPSGVTSTVNLSSDLDPTYGVATGIATVTLPSSTAAGTYNISATYNGDTNYTAASTQQAAITVSNSQVVGNCAPYTSATTSSCLASTTTATATSTSTNPTAAVTINTTVTGQSGKPAPTGVVYFLLGVLDQTNAQNAALDIAAEINLQPGTGDISTAAVTGDSEGFLKGANLLTVYYTGDSNYAASSATIDISNPESDFALTSASSIVPVAASGTATTTLYVTPVNGFNGTVGLGCAIQGSPTGVSCSLASSSVTLTSTTTTTGPISKNRRLNLFTTGGGAIFAFVLLLAVPARKRAWRNMLCLVLFACLIGFASGCGGSGGPANLGGSGSSGSGGSSGGSGGSGGSVGTGGAVSNPQQSVVVTLTTSGATSGNYGVVITGTSSATSQIHTLGFTAAVQ